MDSTVERVNGRSARVVPDQEIAVELVEVPHTRQHVIGVPHYPSSGPDQWRHSMRVSHSATEVAVSRHQAARKKATARRDHRTNRPVLTTALFIGGAGMVAAP